MNSRSFRLPRCAQAGIPRTVPIDAEGRVIDQVVSGDESRWRALRKEFEAGLAGSE